MATTEDTVYDGTVLDDKTANKNETTIIETTENDDSTDVKKSGSVWRRAAAGAGAGILLGTAASFLTSSAVADDSTPESDIKPENPVVDVADSEINVAAGVNDDMSFSEAFAAARAEVGAGGAFEWHGNMYSTYTAEEWNNMTDAEKDSYYDHFKWSDSSDPAKEEGKPADGNTGEQQQESNGSNGNETGNNAEHQNTEENQGGQHTVENEDIEIVDVEPSKTSGQVEVVDVQPTEPEIELLGVAYDENIGGNIGAVTVDDQEVFFVDVDNDMKFDIMASDVDHDGNLSENEVVDISDQNLMVSDLDAGGSMFAANDDAGFNDYVNDSIDV